MRQAQYQATIGAGSEAQRMLGMDAATRQQLTGEQRDLAGFGNEAALGQFGMGAQQGQFANQAALGQFGMGAQAANQNFQQQLAALGFGNEAQQQAWQQQMAGGAQNFNQQMQASQYQTQLRQQQIAEEMQKRGFSLNEINALISGQQVAMPNMPGFSNAQRAEGTQNLAAAQMQGQSALDAYNAEQAAMQGMMSGLGSMAGGFAMMSDRRMKTDIERIGTTPGGTPVYSFRYIFGGPTTIGVMADEVPHAAFERGGIKFVDYAKVR
jgi:hypothetical protein